LVAAAVIVVAYLAPYFYLEGRWWRFIPSTLLILSAGALAIGPSFRGFFGIDMTKRAIVSSVALLVLALPAAHLALSEVVISEGLAIHRDLAARWQIHQLFQVLNDELVTRAALLTILMRAFTKPKAIILGVSLVFAASHQVFYGSDGLELAPSALATLFAFGVIANTLFVRFGHIGYGLALHYAWNFWRFNIDYYLDGERLSQGATFNYVEGNPWLAAGAVLSASLVFASYVRWARSDSHECDA